MADEGFGAEDDPETPLDSWHKLPGWAQISILVLGVTFLGTAGVLLMRSFTEAP